MNNYLIIVNATFCGRDSFYKYYGLMREKYDKLKIRSGGKRAIVAIARTLLIRMRRLLLDNTPYIPRVVSSN